MSAAKLVPAVFEIEDIVQDVPGFHDPLVRWNGWACPFFERAAVDTIVAAFAGSADVCGLRWDTDTVVEIGDDGEETDRYWPIERDGRTLWTIGSHCWTWVVEEPATEDRIRYHRVELTIEVSAGQSVVEAVQESVALLPTLPTLVARVTTVEEAGDAVKPEEPLRVVLTRRRETSDVQLWDEPAPKTSRRLCRGCRQPVAPGALSCPCGVVAP